MPIHRRTAVGDGLVTSYLESGTGDPVVLLHGGEFGASAELGWEHNIVALAKRYRVLAPDLLGFGQSAKVVDFVDGRGMRIRHVARFCDVVGVDSAHFAGNSMGAIMLLTDATSDAPRLPIRTMAIICGGGQIQQNRHFEALQRYDATLDGMRRIVEALFHDARYPADEDYVRRRYQSSIVPGAWEAVAAARCRRPGAEPESESESAPASESSSARPYQRISVPTLVVEGRDDKLLPAGWAAQLAKQVTDGRAVVIDDAGHCPQIEQSSAVNELLLDFLSRQKT
ncbi:alpha/beta hydrolase [Mycobacterium kansasii]|nr:alpha/beta hydrolase [Mycobacterium kansasii]